MAMLVPEHPGRLASDTRFRLSVAGAESNVAAYLSMLGAEVSWISKVGEDPFGQFMLNELRGLGIDVGHAGVAQGYPTGVAFKDRAARQTKVWYYRSGSAASTVDEVTAETVSSLDSKLIHLSGITLALSPSCEGFMREIIRTKRAGTRISFDVNWRPALWAGSGSEPVLDFAQASDIVFVGLDEAQALWGSQDEEAVRDLLHSPEILVVKRGAEGSTIFHKGSQVSVPALSVDVVEPVGAGDAFAAGFLAGYLKGMSMRSCGRLGTITASTALSVETDIGVLPGKKYIEELLELPEEAWMKARFAPGPAESSFSRVTNR